MEDRGESVVAVARGTKHALTVTLLSDNRRGSFGIIHDDTSLSTDKNTTRISHSSVETNTERRCGIHTPLCDVRHASSYGFTDSPYTAAIPQSISSMSKSQDPFAVSLRKYPAEGSSAELIQRIINYTRTKNYSRKRYSRSSQSLIQKSNLQATNAFDVIQEHPEDITLSSIKFEDLSQKELVNYTYDYLKSSAFVPQNTDVRYFTEVRKRIRGRLKGLIDEKSVICPWMQSRFNRHKQRCFRKNALINKDFETQELRRNVISPTNSNKKRPIRHTASSNIVSCRSRCKPCFCHRPPSLDDEKLINRHKPIQNLRQEPNELEELISYEGQTPKEKKKEEFENEINEWLKTIPVYPNFSRKDRIKREKLINKLTKTLKILQKELNFSSLSKKKIIQCLEILPMWCPDDSKNKGILMDQLADDLIKRLSNLAEKNFKTAISEEVIKLPFDSNVNDNTVKEAIDECINKLKHQHLKVGVIDIIKDLPLHLGKQSDGQIELADKFLEKLNQYIINKTENELLTIDNKMKETEKKIWDWCLEVPELFQYTANHYLDLVQCLAKKFNTYELHDKEACDLIKLQNDLKDCFNRFFIQNNINLSSERINILSNKLLNRILDSEYTTIKINNDLNEDKLSNKSLQYIMEWFLNIPEFSAKANDKEILKALNCLAIQLQAFQIDDDDIDNILSNMKEIVLNWLHDTIEANDVQIDSKTQDNLVNDLILRFIATCKQKNEREYNEHQELYKDVITWLKELSNIRPYDYSEQNNLVREFVVRVMGVIRGSNGDRDWDVQPNIEKEIKKFVEKLSENSEMYIREEDMDKLKLKVFSQVKKLPQRRKHWDKDNNWRHVISLEIANGIDSIIDLPEKIKSKITNVVLENTKENTIDWDKTVSQIINILKQETLLTNNEIKNIANKTVGKINDILLRYETTPTSPLPAGEAQFKLHDASYKKSKTESFSAQVDKSHNMEDNSSNSKHQSVDFENQILSSELEHLQVNQTSDLSAELGSMSSLNYKPKKTNEKYSNDVRNNNTIKTNKSETNMSKNHTYIASQNRNGLNNTLKNDTENRETRIEKENTNGSPILKSIDMAAKAFDKKMAQRTAISELVTSSLNSFENVNNNMPTEIETKSNDKAFLEKHFSTSTPLTSTVKYPSAVSVDVLPTSGNITRKTKEELSDSLEYINQLKIIIRNWLNHFTLHLDEREKYELVDNIANDILERQKYLQISDTVTSATEELEHLKYQIFKRLSKINNYEAVFDVISNVDCLHYRILSIKVPKLLTSAQNNQSNIDNLIQKITKWFNIFPPLFITTFNNSKCQEAIFLELAQNLETLKKNNQYDNAHVEKEISRWLSSVLRDISSEKLRDLTKSLKLYLNDTTATETFIPKQNTSEFVVENLSGAIIEWYRASQYRYKLQDEIQDYFALTLASEIKQIFGQSLSDDELNTLLIQEIVKNLNKITGHFNHSTFHYAIASDLLGFLKGLKLFHDISKRETTYNFNRSRIGKDTRYKDEIKETLINWVNNLPLRQDINTVEVKDIAHNFMTTVLKYCASNNIFNLENFLKEYILDFLATMPLRNDTQEYKDIEIQATSLAAKIKDIYVHKQPQIIKETSTRDLQNVSPSILYKQLLHDTISKTFFENLTLEEQISFNLLKEKLADAFINLYYLIENKQVRDKYKNKLYREINKFCDNYVKRYRVDIDTLQGNLHQILKDVPIPTIASKEYLNQDKLKHEIQEWIKSIAVRQSGDDECIAVMISTLAERLTPLLNKPEFDSNIDNEMKREIFQWLQKLSFGSEDISDIINRFIRKLKNLAQIDDSAMSLNKYMKNKSDLKKHASSQYTAQLPLASLSIEDTAHLKRIRARSHISSKVESLDTGQLSRSKPSFINTYADIGTQTNINNKVARSVQTSNIAMTESLSISKEITPQVIIREFHWDSSGSKESVRTIKPPTTSSQIEIPNKTKVTSKSQTVRNINEIDSSEQPAITHVPVMNVSKTKETEIQTIDHFRTNSTLQSLSEDTQDSIALGNAVRKQNKINGANKLFDNKKVTNEYLDKTRAKETANKSQDDNRRMLKRTTAITENESDQRLHAAPTQLDTRESAHSQISCSCKNHLLTVCRNKPSAACRQVAVKSTFTNCSKCLACCPHPTYFFFRKHI